jgi:hypothetical protein
MSPEELKFFQEIDALIKPIPRLQLEYRLYYNSDGNIVACTQIADSTLTDPYVVATKEQYDRYFDYRVVNAQLKKIDHDAGYRVQLKRSTTGYAVVKGHAGLPIESTDTYTDIEYYDRNN